MLPPKRCTEVSTAKFSQQGDLEGVVSGEGMGAEGGGRGGGGRRIAQGGGGGVIDEIPPPITTNDAIDNACVCEGGGVA